MVSSPNSVQTLKKLLRHLPPLDRALQDILIPIAAALDRALEECIVSRMVPLSPKDRAALFQGDSPLAGLSAKIRAGYAMGLYCAFTRNQLDNLREIRNAFAHSLQIITFDTPEVEVVCRRLRPFPSMDGPDIAKYPNRGRVLYMLIASYLLGVFLSMSQKKVQPPPGFRVDVAEAKTIAEKSSRKHSS